MPQQPQRSSSSSLDNEMRILICTIFVRLRGISSCPKHLFNFRSIFSTPLSDSPYQHVGIHSFRCCLSFCVFVSFFYCLVMLLCFFCPLSFCFELMWNAFEFLELSTCTVFYIFERSTMYKHCFLVDLSVFFSQNMKMYLVLL